MTYSIEIISKGSFLDPLEDDDGKKKLYSVTVYTVRLSNGLINEYFDTEANRTSLEFDKHSEYLEYLNSKWQAKVDFNARIAKMLGIPFEGVSVSRAFSEVFTVNQVLQVV